LLTTHSSSRSFNFFRVLKEREPGRAVAVVTRRTPRPFSCSNYFVKRSSALATAALLPAPAAGLRPPGLRGVLLRLLIELPLALVRAEVVVRDLKLGLCGSLLIVYLHSTNRIRLHCHVFLLDLNGLTKLQARQAKLSEHSSLAAVSVASRIAR